ncbi:MAG TPA: hypothetical protein VMV69_02685 [Pirellulales bacterium]|nr:hypothetical protein [Pirellulales bacterium]
MNAANPQRPWLFAVIAATMIVLSVFAVLELRSARAAALAAIRSHAECEELAGEIAKLGAKPSHVTLQTQSSTDVAGRIEAAAQFAQLPMNSLVRIDPQPARRLGDSVYKEQATHVELREVTLKQLIEFLHHLHGSKAPPGPGGGTSFRAKSLYLTAPAQTTIAGAGTETWRVELTLTYLIFAPKNAPARK